MQMIGCDLHARQQTRAILDCDTGTVEERVLRALLRYRHQWVRIRTRVQNALQAIALGL